jgi:hypothetical protein
VHNILFKIIKIEYVFHVQTQPLQIFLQSTHSTNDTFTNATQITHFLPTIQRNYYLQVKF